MTTDNAIAVLRRMQEPDPFEPQITQTAFDALEMAIDMIERYSTWSQTYSNMVEDAISRKAAVDVIHKYFAERIEQLPTHTTKDGEVYDLGICNPLLADNKALSQAIKELPSVQSDLIATIQNGIKATDANDVYSCGMRNGMRWCKSLIDGKEPLYENCPSAPPTEASCWGCNCQKMERLKEQKTFSEMVHLHDAETHEERTETHGVCLDTISRRAAIDALMAWEEGSVWDEECLKHRGEPYWVAPSDVIEQLPSAQPERTCVNCGRTANNGGWYADGRTRCPIEEHYALPKDGYCHLWEKRNVTDDDYPERREK